MTDEARNRIETLELLRKSATERYVWRAQVEWKLCIALWTALAAFIGAVLTGKGIAPPKMSVWLMITVSMFICILAILHGLWLRGLAQAQKLDNDVAFFFRDRMMEEVGVHFPPKIFDEIEKANKRNGIEREDQGSRIRWWRHWSRFFQFGVTVLLALGAVAAVVWAAAGNAPKP